MDVSAVNGPSQAVNVKLQKGQQKQQEKVVSTLLDGATKPSQAPRPDPLNGQNLNIKA